MPETSLSPTEILPDAEEPSAVPAGSSDGEAPGDPVSDLPSGAASDDTSDGASSPDFSEMERSDLRELKLLFPEMEDADDLTVLADPRRFGELREMGLSAEEAYRAVGKLRASRTDNRSHLRSAVPRTGVSDPGGMTEGELSAARDLFGDLSDSEIRSLYRKVNK